MKQNPLELYTSLHHYMHIGIRRIVNNYSCFLFLFFIYFFFAENQSRDSFTVQTSANVLKCTPVSVKLTQRENTHLMTMREGNHQTQDLTQQMLQDVVRTCKRVEKTNTYMYMY